MKKKVLRFGKGFKVLIGNSRVQAAQMVIEPGRSEGGPKNRHRGCDQWLVVVAGTGTAIIGGFSASAKCQRRLHLLRGQRPLAADAHGLSGRPDG